MLQMTEGDFKSQFSQVPDSVLQGNEVMEEFLGIPDAPTPLLW